jgi:hypothetical protein
MKKVPFFLIIFCLGMSFQSFSQTATSADFFAGKWEISATGTPYGDVKFVTDLVRKDGKLTGELANATDSSQPKRPITKVEEKGTSLVLYFESSQGGEVPIDLKKMDDDNLKGTLYTFDATAKRIKG